LKREEILEIYQNTEILTAKELAKQYRVSIYLVYNIWAKKCGTKITDTEVKLVSERAKRVGDTHHSCVLSDATVEKIRGSRQSAKVLAEIYQTTPQTIYRIRNGNRRASKYKS
jgi:Mor family transcriptional regulator